jgi:hypothetical protein
MEGAFSMRGACRKRGARKQGRRSRPTLGLQPATQCVGEILGIYPKDWVT